MSRNVVLLISIVILTCASFASVVQAEENTEVDIIASSSEQTELIILQQSGNRVRWKLVFAENEGQHASENTRRLVSGEVDVGNLSLRKELESLLELQTDAAQWSARREAEPSVPAFSLLLKDDTRPRISWPLTSEEHRTFIDSELVKVVLHDIKSRKVLLKGDNILDFIFPERQSLIREKRGQERTNDR